MSSMISCAHGFNHYGVRDVLINNNMKSNECPRCSKIEMWDHVIKCVKTKEIRRNYIIQMTIALLKNKEEYISHNVIFNMIEDIMVYLENGDPDEYETTQHYIGMDAIFRGFIVRDWKEANFQCNKYRIVNKIVITHSVQFYRKC